MSEYRTFQHLNLPELDKEILSYWEKHQIFKKSLSERPEDNAFVFYEGPPSANGKPGIHHVMARAIKDMYCRYKTMKGFRVDRKGGWDTHGLPIELAVEKELGITKEDIGTKISVDDYNAKCKETVMTYKDMWDDLTIKMGYWVDLDHPYVTFEKEYMETVWWLLKQLYDKGFMYKGYTIQPYSPAAGTGLSTHELNQPGCYKDVMDTTAVAQFKIVKDKKSLFLFEDDTVDNVCFIAWTTTPWTLPSNTALAVGSKIDYVKVKTYNPYTKLPVQLILAEKLLANWFKPEQADLDYDAYNPDDKMIPYQILGSYKGSQLEGVNYEQLLPYVQPDEGDSFRMILGDFVSTEDGTGIVHIAPSFGADDMFVAKQNNIGSLTLVDKQGKFVDEVSDFARRYVKDYKDDPNYVDVNVDIAIKMKIENKAFNVQKYSHSYPHCWRTDKPILYYPLDSWFVKASSYKERMSELNNTINWKPKHTGEGRFGKWLENLQDWNLSRSRYWGIPLPIWRTPDGEQEKCIGSLESLQHEIDLANEKLNLNQSMPEDIHRPYIDDIKLVSDDGILMTRELDLIDVWFDSGSMPYAQWHYPFENKEKFESSFPADFISEGVDQTRGWFYTLHAISSMVFDSVAFKNIVSTGLVQDKKGQKMSKRLGNTVDPFATISTYGADATRWYMMSNAQPWDNLKFDIKGLDEVRRKFFGTLYNIYSFYAMYANIDQFSYKENKIPVVERPEIDRWIISLLNSLKKSVDQQFDDYESTNAARLIQVFVDDHLSNWYVRLCRRRFWKGDYSQDKIAAYQTLYECMSTLSQLMAPIAPFFAEWLYKNLNDVTGKESHESVHLSYFPTADESVIDKDLEQRMDYAQRISSLVLSLRKKDNIRVRQPLGKILIPILDSNFAVQVDKVKSLILAEVNVKEIDFLTEDNSVIKKQIKPNFRTLGKRLGRHMKAASQLIAQLSQDDISTIEFNKGYKLEVEEDVFELGLEDFEITSKDIPGWQVATDKGLTVALEINLTEELLAEGIAREIVNRVQNIRKSMDFNITDRINIEIENHEKLQGAISQFGEYIKNEVLANSLILTDDISCDEKIDLVDDLSICIKVSKV